jgi:DNA-binding FrmR family transcriptional regulator
MKEHAVSHTIRDRVKLLGRVRRIRGQVEALERAIDEAHECTQILQQIAACRGAVNGLMAEVLEGHIREHLIDPARAPTRAEGEALEDLAQVIKRYLK